MPRRSLMDHFTQFFPAICAGLGLFLAGAANLLLLRKRFVLRAIATVAAVGVALAAAAAIEQPGTVANTARLMAYGLIPFVLLGSRRLIAGAAAVVAASGRPAVRYALLTVGGIGLAIGSVVVYERADDAVMADDMAEMEFMHSHLPTTPVAREKAATDRGTPIVLQEPVGSRDSQSLSDLEERIFSRSSLKDLVIRHGAADDRSNCHGWVFTAGRFLVRGIDVDVILKDNSYSEHRQPQPGDLVIYRTLSGSIAHTAVVQYVTKGEPVLVRGKWGNLGVFTHPVDKSPYGAEYTFYRSPRTGHLLATTPVSTGDGPVTVRAE
jgi:hypothetical protein